MITLIYFETTKATFKKTNSINLLTYINTDKKSQLKQLACDYSFEKITVN